MKQWIESQSGSLDYRVVIGMRSNEAHESCSLVVTHGDHQAVIVPLDVAT